MASSWALWKMSGARKADTRAKMLICTKLCSEAASPRICGKMLSTSTVMAGTASAMPRL